MPLRLVSRKEWKAKQPGMREPLNLPVPYVLLDYYTRPATRPCTGDKECIQVMQDMQEHHQQVRFYPDIKYSFLIGSDGTVYEGRGWFVNPTKQDSRLIDFYGQSIDIALIGNYQEYDPPPIMMQAVQDLITYGVRSNFITDDYELVHNRNDTIMPFDAGYAEAYANNHTFEHVPY